MSTRLILINARPYFYGLSKNGFYTRLFLNRQEAIKEETWLNERWDIARKLWDQVYSDPDDDLRAARTTLRRIMTAASRGLRPLISPSTHEQDHFFRSEAHEEAPQIVHWAEDGTVTFVAAETAEEVVRVSYQPPS